MTCQDTSVQFSFLQQGGNTQTTLWDWVQANTQAGRWTLPESPSWLRSKPIQVQTRLGTAAGQEDSTDTTRAAAANLPHQWRGCLVHLWVHTQGQNRGVSARKRHFHCQGVSEQHPLTRSSHNYDPPAEGVLYTSTPQLFPK